MRQAVGIISVVQEGRFRLDGGDGRAMHFTLDRHGRVEPQDLPLFGAAPVVVSYRDSRWIQGHVALDIREASS